MLMIVLFIIDYEEVRITTKTKKVSKIPSFKNHEEEAKFCETHSVADYMDEFKQVEARFAKNLSEGLHIRLDPDTLMKLRYEAKEKGIGPTTLVRVWIRDQLRSSRHHA